MCEIEILKSNLGSQFITNHIYKAELDSENNEIRIFDNNEQDWCYNLTLIKDSIHII